MDTVAFTPKLEVLGVYRLDVTPEVFASQLPMYGDEAQCRDHFSSVVLIEAIVEDHTGNFSLSGVHQPELHLPDRSIHAGIPTPGAHQAPWDEGLLSPDGERLLARTIDCVKGTGPLRFAFYLHYWNEGLPLQWSYGDVPCPAPEIMPERLQRLMPYRPCD